LAVFAYLAKHTDQAEIWHGRV